MKIYTRKGDQGQTSLIGGTRVPKDHQRVAAYGEVDELNSWLGLIASFDLPEGQSTLLKDVQDQLFTVGSSLAADPEHAKMVLPDLRDEDLLALEQAIDAMEASLEPLKNFILPGGHPEVAQVHIARCVCRRVERAVVQLSATSPVDGRIIPYLNRLSDYCFVLARALSRRRSAQEILWKPRV